MTGAKIVQEGEQRHFKSGLPAPTIYPDDPPAKYELGDGSDPVPPDDPDSGIDVSPVKAQPKKSAPKTGFGSQSDDDDEDEDTGDLSDEELAELKRTEELGGVKHPPKPRPKDRPNR
jgi:hypothetical protein